MAEWIRETSISTGSDVYYNHDFIGQIGNLIYYFVLDYKTYEIYTYNTSTKQISYVTSSPITTDTFPMRAIRVAGNYIVHVTLGLSKPMAIYNISSKSWATTAGYNPSNELGSSEAYVTGFGVASGNGSTIYFIGGKVSGPVSVAGPSRRIYQFNASSDSRPSLLSYSTPSDREDPSCIYYNGYIYMYGGYYQSVLTNSLYIIDTTTGSYKQNNSSDLTSESYSRKPIPAVYENKIYFNTTGLNSTLSVYDINSDTFESLRFTTGQRGYAAMNDRLYAFQYNSISSSVQGYMAYLELGTPETNIIDPSPTSGIINDLIDQTFEWGLDVTPSSATQSSAEFQWRIGSTGTAKTIPVSGNRTSVTIPGGTFPTSGTIQWRVRATATNNVTSAWTSWYTLTMTTKYLYVVDLQPISGQISELETNRFSWKLDSTLPNPVQKSAIYQWRIGTTGTVNQRTVSGTATYIDITSGTFPSSGTIQWRVQATSTDGLTSTWSAWYTLGITTKYLYVVNPQPVTGEINELAANQFTWQLDSTIPNPVQKSATFQWRAGTTGTVNTVPITGTATYVIIPAKTFPSSSTIQWRVQAVSTSNLTSEWTSWYTIGIASKYIFVTSASPQGGFLNEQVAQTLSWDYYSDPEGAKQTSARVEWQNVANTSVTNVINVTNANTYVTIAANVLPNGSFRWRVQVAGDNNATSEFTPWYTISTIDAVPLPPTNLNPDYTIGAAKDKGSSIQFTWFHNSPYGTPQRAYEVQINYNGGADDKDYSAFSGKVVSATSIFNAAPNSIHPADPMGRIWWRVRTYNSDDVASPWSYQAGFIVQGPPDPPSWVSVTTDRSFPIAKWTAPQQVSFQLQVRDLSGKALYETSIIDSQTTTHEISDQYFDDGAYVFAGRVGNSRGYWSEWATTTVTIRTQSRISIHLTDEALKNGHALFWTVEVGPPL